MMRLALLVLVGLCAASCQTPPARPPEVSQPYHLVDLTGDYRAFFDRTQGMDVYLVHSLGEMDGGTRTIGGNRYLVFGADVMARLYAPGDERPFVQHEVFHVYHDQFFTGCGEVWCALWREGLAVYVSEQLNPGATDAQLGLAAPRPIRAEVDSDRATAVCAVRARLRSDRREDYASMFFGQAVALAFRPGASGGERRALPAHEVTPR